MIDIASILDFLMNALGFISQIGAHILSFAISVLRFIILIGVLIFVHELGHFIVAKLCNVYVARFSLGFGRKLFGFKRGETEYRVSAIPLGGYVKMVGQEDMPRTQEEALEAEPELANVPRERRFDTQPTRTRLAISFAGPLMNLLFAFPVLWVMLMMGVPVPINVMNTFVGTVLEESPAAKAGIEPGQRIISIDGDPVNRWEEVELKTLTSEDKPLKLTLENTNGERVETIVTPARAEGSSRASIGVRPLDMVKIEEVFADMPAGKAGLKAGDIVITYNHEPPDNETMSQSKLIEFINERPGEPVILTILRDNRITDIEVVPESVSAVEDVHFQGNTVALVVKEKAGHKVARLQPGDVITALDGEAVTAPELKNLNEAISEKTGKTVALTVKRSMGILGKEEVFAVEVPLVRRGMIGVQLSDREIERYGPGRAFVESFGQFKDAVGLTMMVMYYLVSGQVSPREMAGPIGIAVMTEQTLKMAGVAYYLNLVAIITINLGILNLLPVPILDGGMIMITLVERIRRKPLDEKYMILLQRIGIAFVFFLVLMATYNDLIRVARHLMGGQFLD